MDDQEQEPWLVRGLRQTVGAPLGAFMDHVAQRGDEHVAQAAELHAQEQAERASKLDELRRMWQQIQQNGLFSLRDQPVRTE